MNDKLFYQKPVLLYLLLGFSALAYYVLVYETARENFLQLISLFTFLFIVYYITYNFFSAAHLNYLIFAGSFFRFLLLFSVPNLSEDVYRFIWDGRVAANGINPFNYLPLQLMQMQRGTGLTVELFGQLNSPGFYSVYPPVLQGIFWIVAKLFPLDIFGAMIAMKCFIFTTELATFYLLIQILKKLSLPKHLCLLYILNPLVISELTGNVHFEGLMIFFVLLAFLLYLNHDWWLSAIFLGLGVATKLLPLLFLPLMFKKLGWRKGIIYSTLTVMTTLVLFSLVFDIATIQHLLKSVDLFLRRFEFNASVYYFVRWIGKQVTGYNIIAYAGPALAIIAAGLIFSLSFQDKKTTKQADAVKLLFIISTWFIFSTTVHPWYICLPVALSVFTPYRYAIIWSFTAILSYLSYHYKPVQENLWLLGAGYIVMLGYAFWEVKNNNFRTKIRP